MRLAPLYRVEFSYPEHYEIGGADVGGIFLAEGHCEVELTGRFRGLNHPRLRPDNVYLPDFQGVIETEDGAKIAFDYHGYGRARDYGREIVGTAFHSTGDERYAKLTTPSPSWPARRGRMSARSGSRSRSSSSSRWLGRSRCRDSPRSRARP